MIHGECGSPRELVRVLCLALSLLPSGYALADDGEPVGVVERDVESGAAVAGALDSEAPPPAAGLGADSVRVLVCVTRAAHPDEGAMQWPYGPTTSGAEVVHDHSQICRDVTRDPESRALRADVDQLDVALGGDTRIWVVALDDANAPVAATRVGVTHVHVDIDGNRVASKALEDFSEELAERGVLIVNLAGADTAAYPHGSRVIVRVVRVGAEAGQEGSELRRYARLDQPLTPYSSFGGALPVLWLPVGIFGTNFSATERGIPFTILPIGLAGGIRWHTATNFYVGLSAMANWAITVQDGEGIRDAVTSATSADRQTVFLASLTVGVLLDLANIAYVGGAALLDLRTNTLDPVQPLVVFGLAPGLLQILQALG